MWGVPQRLTKTSEAQTLFHGEYLESMNYFQRSMEYSMGNTCYYSKQQNSGVALGVPAE